MYKKCIVPVEQLNKRVNLDRIPFQTTADVKPLSTVIGQDRAVNSINFALEIEDSGYNIFVTGSYGTGRTTIVRDLLNKAAKKRPAPDDWVFVFNFENPDEPRALRLPAGKAAKLKKQMQRLINSLRIDLQKTFESKNYTERKNEIIEAVQNQKQQIYSALEKEAEARNIRIKSSSMGFVTIPIKDGKTIKNEEYQQMSEEEQNAINQNLHYVQKRLQQVVRELTKLDRYLADQIEELNQKIARYVVTNHFATVQENFANCEQVKQYLEEAAEDIIENIEEFVKMDGEEEGAAPAGDDPALRVNKYQINVLIDNSKQKGAPVIYETNPTYSNLFGRIEKKSYHGFLYTDYTMIKAGSLLSANGGYLVLDSEQLLKHPFAYEALKRTLRSKELRIEDVNTFYGISTTVSLRPDPVPLDIKVIMIGQPYLYRMLHNYDEEFRKIFKVKADFDVEVKETPASVRKYVQFISRVVHEENLLHFDRSGVSAVLEYGFRLADHQKRLSIRFGELVRIIREASFWAKKGRKKIVTGKEVRKAIDNLIYRHDLVEEKFQDAINDNFVKVDVAGKKIGQVNGLAVYNLGDYAFGKPSRITANTYIGSRGIINIEREARMSGRIHDKGVLILTGYFSQKFGTTMPLSFSASLTFEQSYGMIDGDSASSAELYALLSSLAQVPVKQSIAVTGSVNQKGEVQAIGGVNEKIEGFYKVCAAKGLTGEQGVIIPEANIKNLLLNEEIVQAVKDGKFHIWAVNNVEDGIRLLTDTTCGVPHKDGTFTKDSIFDKVQKRLIEFARTAQQFRKTLGEENKKEEKENSED